MTNLERLNEARATLDRTLSEAYGKLKEAKEEAKRVREQAKKNAPDKAAKKALDEACKATIRKAEEECGGITTKALSVWSEAHDKYRGGKEPEAT